MVKTKGAKPVSQIWAEAKEIPVADVAPPTAAAKRAKWMRRGVKSSVILMPLVLLALLVAVGNRGSTKAAAAAPASSSSQGRGAATVVLQQWLAGPPAPLPGGNILSWDGATRNVPPTSKDNTDTTPVFPTERDEFTISDSSGRYYRAEMLVALDPSGGSKVLSGPSLTPIPAARDAGSADEYQAWGSLRSGNVPDAVSASVQAWATAFTSGQPSALRLSVGDKDPNHAYLPLPDATGATVSVKQGAYLGVSAESATSSTMIVRASIVVSYGAPPAAAGRDLVAPPAATYDLLVDGADTAAPVVVAWGGPGSGPGLSAYVNAMPSDVPTDYLTATPSASDSTPVSPAPVSSAPVGPAAPSSSTAAPGAPSAPVKPIKPIRPAAPPKSAPPKSAAPQKPKTGPPGAGVKPPEVSKAPTVSKAAEPGKTQTSGAAGPSSAKKQG